MSLRTLSTVAALTALLAVPALAGAVELDPACPAAPDCVAPTDTTTPAAGWYTAPQDFPLNGTDDQPGAVTMEYSLDGAPSGTIPAGGTVHVDGEGVHTLSHRAIDAAGNKSDWTDETIRLDWTNPSNATAAVSNAWRNSDASIIVLGSDGGSGVDHVEWKIDGTLSSGPQGSTATISGEGTHTLETRVVDVAGNVSSWRTDQVRIDTVVPTDTTAISAGWRASSATLTVSGSDASSGVAKVEWIVDGGGVQSALAASSTFTISAEGEHSVQTRVTDAAGNVSGWRDHIVRIDSTMPTNLTPVASPNWRNSDYAVALDASDAGSGLAYVEWSVDGSPPQQKPAGTVVHVTGTGAHMLRTRAFDVAGNSSAWRTDAVNIDTVAPVNTTPTAPASPVANPYVVAVSGSDGDSGIDHVEWKVDGVDGSGTSGSTVTITGDGAHAFSSRVIDDAGNASPWRDETITIDVALNNDTTAPLDTTTTVPATWRTADVTVKLNGTDANGVAEMRWRLDGSAIASAAPGTTIAITGDGVHHLETMAVDTSDNTSAWRAQTIRIDTTVPVDDTPIPTAWQRSRTFTLEGHDATSGIDVVEYRIDGGAVQSGPAGSTVTLASDGAHDIEHRAIDRAGQASAWTTGTLKVDTVDPVNTTPAAPSGWQSTAWSVTPAGTDDRSGIDVAEWRLDGGDPGTGPLTVDADGTHTVDTRVVDAAGNDSGWRTDSVQVDTHAPADTTLAVPAGWRRTPWTISPSADDGAGSGVARVEWKLGAAGVVHDAAVDPSVTVADDGVTAVFTRAVDVVGHVSDWREQTVRIDTVAPVATLDCGDGAWKAAAVDCAVGADGGPSGIDILTFTRAGADTAVSAGGHVAIAADGAWTVALRAVDGAGNQATVTRVVRIDRTPPVAGLSCGAAATPTGWTCRASGTDATSGVAALRWRVNGGAWQSPTSHGSFTVASGHVEVLAVDNAGVSALSPAVDLAVRTVPTPTTPSGGPAPHVRTRAVPVSRRGARGKKALLGEFALRSERVGRAPARATADVRPLVLGSGRYRITIRLTSGQLTAKRARTMTFRSGGLTPRMGVALSGVKRTMRARLTVERRSHGRWRLVARAGTSLKP